MAYENIEIMVKELRTAYLALVHACMNCNMSDADERKTVFRLKEEVFGLYIKKYTLFYKIKQKNGPPNCG